MTRCPSRRVRSEFSIVGDRADLFPEAGGLLTESFGFEAALLQSVKEDTLFVRICLTRSV